jgi:hypothetical protein
MLSFFLSNLSFSNVEDLSSCSSEIVCWQAACNGPPVQMALVASRFGWTAPGVISDAEQSL